MIGSTVEDARAAILEDAELLGVEAVSIDRAVGRVLAADVRASRDQPPFRAASMDGYAARRADLGKPLRLVGRSAAGARFGRGLVAGECVRIFTGAPVPAGADVVAPQENATSSTAGVVLEPGHDSFIREQGGDFRVGATLMASGERIDAWRLALIASSGAAEVRVARRPRVIVLTSGNELVPAGAPPGADQVFDSAGPAVLARAVGLGAEALGIRHVRDDRDAVMAALRDARCDVLICIGGASVGDADHFRPAAEALGARLTVAGVRVRPGRPTWFARLPDGSRVLGLPGNPSSALVCVELFLRPLLAALQGARSDLPIIRGRLTCPTPANGQREHWMRAQVSFADGAIHVTPDDDQDSGWTGVFARAGALVRRPIGAPVAASGDLVDILVLERM